jgi:hypothetical protein
MSRPTLYLCGPIQHAADDGKGWREDIRSEHSDSFSFQDPWDKYPDDATNDEILADDCPPYWSDAEIMAGDREQIDKSDGLLIRYEGEPTWGSPREMEYVSDWGRGPDIPCVIVADDEDRSPWMHDALAIVETFHDAMWVFNHIFYDH